MKPRFPSVAMLEVLKNLANAEREENWDDAEIVCDGNSCWLGDVRVAKRTVKQLLKCVALRYDTLGGAEHYSLNDTGRAIIRRPELANDVVVALMSERPFTIVNDHIMVRRGQR